MTVTDVRAVARPRVDPTPLEDASAQLRGATDLLGYDDGVYDTLAGPRRDVTVNVPLRRDNGTVEVLTGHRVQHKLSRWPAKVA